MVACLAMCNLGSGVKGTGALLHGDFGGALNDYLGILSPKPPGIPKVKKPPVLDPGAVAKKQAIAAEVAATKAAGAYGWSDTVLTGPMGLGSVPSQNLKTLLGQ